MAEDSIEDKGVPYTEYTDYGIEDEPDDIDYALLGIEPPRKQAWQTLTPAEHIDPVLEGSVDLLIDWADGWVDDLLLKPERIEDEEERLDAEERKRLATLLLHDARACPEVIPELCAMAHLVGRTPREALEGIEASLKKRQRPSQRLEGGRN